MMGALLSVRGLPWQLRWAAWRFASHRGDYYDHVATCLDVQSRHQSLLEFLQQDARRHTGREPRAVLARWWASRYLMTGANLTETLRGTLPASDVACLELAQQAGLQALLQMLRSLASQCTQLAACQRDFLQTVLAGVIAMVVALVSLMWMPIYTLPKLMQTFSMVTPQQYGDATLRLMRWSAWVVQWWWLMLLGLFAIVALLRWSLQNWTSPMRDRCDGIGVWRLWRDLQAVEFLALTSTLLLTLGSRGMSLRNILQMQVSLAHPYRQCHLVRMLLAMDLGLDSVDAMNTGMIDRSCWWRLQDLVQGYGLTTGFAQASEQVLQMLLRRVRRQAQLWRYVLLAVAVSVVLCVGYWHACVFEEMRRALVLGVFLP